MFKKFMYALIICSMLIVCLGAFTRPVAADSGSTSLSYQYKNLADYAPGASIPFANDSGIAKITVIQVSSACDGNAQLIATFDGTFVTWAGISPAGTGTLSKGITGSYTETYTSCLPGGAAINTTGYTGVYDYACDKDGNCADPDVPYVTSLGGWWYNTNIGSSWSTSCHGKYEVIDKLTSNYVEDAGYPIVKGDITDASACKTVYSGWVPTGLSYWKLSMAGAPANSWGYYDNAGHKVALCVMYTIDSGNTMPNTGSQQKVCGSQWNTTESHQFVQYENEGLTKFLDTWTGNWGDPYALQP